MRVFLDANILFSATFSKGHLSAFLGELRHHAILLTNEYALIEAQRNIAVKASRRLATHKKFVASLELVPIHLFDLEVRLASKDQPILCGAINGRADFLLTGDKKDFGHLYGETIHGVRIVSVELMVEELISRGITREA